MASVNIETFNLSKNGLSPPIMRFTFKWRNTTYNLRNVQEFGTERNRTDYFGLETLVTILGNHGHPYQSWGKLTP